MIQRDPFSGGASTGFTTNPVTQSIQAQVTQSLVNNGNKSTAPLPTPVPNIPGPIVFTNPAPTNPQHKDSVPVPTNPQHKDSVPAPTNPNPNPTPKSNISDYLSVLPEISNVLNRSYVHDSMNQLDNQTFQFTNNSADTQMIITFVVPPELDVAPASMVLEIGATASIVIRFNINAINNLPEGTSQINLGVNVGPGTVISLPPLPTSDPNAPGGTFTNPGGPINTGSPTTGGSSGGTAGGPSGGSGNPDNTPRIV